MARFVDLDQDPGRDGSNPSSKTGDLASQLAAASLNAARASNGLPRAGVGLNGYYTKSKTPRLAEVTNSITRAFQCYPVVIAIGRLIDTNTLDSLARTTRNIHNGLIQYRTILLASTLQCVNEPLPVDPEQTMRFRARAGTWEETWQMLGTGEVSKAGHCARDMVGPCRRCSTVICRNCAIKPPAPVTLRERHRRLCQKCSFAPIPQLTHPPLHPSLPLTSDFLRQSVCRCQSEGVWLCQPCGRSIRADDSEYKSIWRWRNQYGEVLGGLGTGIGDGDRGVICGRASSCCAAKDREYEVDCDAEDAKNVPNPVSTDVGPSITQNPLLTALISESFSSTSLQQVRASSPQRGPGYERHEIEGIGGVVKRKLTRTVRVGACVPEYLDESGMGNTALQREVSGIKRSWCGWCRRVIPGVMEKVI